MIRYLILIAIVGCASAGGEQQPGLPPDGGSPLPDAGLPVPPSANECAADQHACGPVCFDRQANDPAKGCALGCAQACPAVANAVATCTPQGTCDFACATGTTRVGDDCVAASCGAYTCGMAADGTSCGSCFGSVACGGDHQCDIPSDAAEYNDASVVATQLGDLDDSDDPVSWLDDLSIDSSTDVDWFSFHITDGFDGGNPDGYVELTTRGSSLGWLSSSHELTVWFMCDSGDAGSTVTCGEWYTSVDQNSLYETALGHGCIVNGTYDVWAHIATSCSGASDSGTVMIRVRKQTVPRGDKYDLRAAVE